MTASHQDAEQTVHDSAGRASADDGQGNDSHKGIDSSRPDWSRAWNYWLSGKDNYPVDREIGEQIFEAHPGIVNIARHMRAFRARIVGYLAEQQGIDQFLDVGTELPLHDGSATHLIAQRVTPTAQIVYVDHEPLVLAHARALLTGTPEGACHVLDAELGDAEAIIKGAADVLDLSRPVAVLLLSLHLLADEDAQHLVAPLVDGLPIGSRMVISNLTDQVDAQAMREVARIWNEGGGAPITLRDPAQIGRFIDHPALAAPRVISCSRWHPPHSRFGKPQAVDAFGAISMVTTPGPPTW